MSDAMTPRSGACNPRVSVVEKILDGRDPIAHEVTSPVPFLDEAPRRRAETIYEWLYENHVCPCKPRQHLDQELALKVEELARSNRDLEQFAYVTSHDLQEPLRMVAAYTQLLAERYRGKLDETADVYIGYASEGALRMQTLIQDLLDFSRVGRSHREPQAVDCNQAAQLAQDNLRNAIAQSGAVILREQLPTVWASRSQLTQVFQNLIGNAIKFHGQERPLISIEAARTDRWWQFSLGDNGIGIAPENAESIFTIFQRLHTRTEYPGNGIGLAICRKIVEHWGGRIWVESQMGCGSTFKFTLPANCSNREEGVRQ